VQGRAAGGREPLVTAEDKPEAPADSSALPLLSSYEPGAGTGAGEQSNEHAEKKAEPLAEQTVPFWPDASNRDAVKHSVYGLKAPYILSSG